VSRRFAARALVTVVLALLVSAPITAAPQSSDDDATVCEEGALPRQRTEVEADVTVDGFDEELGTLLQVTVPTQTLHLDTDAVFEKTAQTAVTFEEHMSYQVTFTSPGGLPSPAPVTGTIQRVPSQTLAAFDGTLDFGGPSAVAQPSTGRDAAAAPVSSSDSAVLAAFTGGDVAFHVASAIGETFTGGGGNVEARINTFAAASVRVCYRYEPQEPPTTSPPTTRSRPRQPPAPPAATAVVAPLALVFTG
jgi:hypothetical protein